MFYSYTNMNCSINEKENIQKLYIKFSFSLGVGNVVSLGIMRVRRGT